MPIYEYTCVANGHRFEVFQKMSDGPPDACPVCGAGEVRKMVSAAAFVLKGGGWYKDHYGLKSGVSSGESATGAASTEKPAAPTSGGGDKGGSGSSGGASSTGGGSSSAPSSGGGSGTSASP